MDESLLIPVIPDDPLLRESSSIAMLDANADEPELDFDDEWSDDEFEPTVQSGKSGKAAQKSQRPQEGPSDSSSQVKNLEAELRKAREDVKRLQSLVQEMTFEEDGQKSDGEDERVVLGPGIKGKGKAVLRDDDTHYFDSYEHNGTLPAPVVHRPLIRS